MRKSIEEEKLFNLSEVWDEKHEDLVIRLKILRGLKEYVAKERGDHSFDRAIDVTEANIRAYIRQEAYNYDPYSEDKHMQELGKLPSIAVAWFVRGVVSIYIGKPCAGNWNELTDEEREKWANIAEHFTYFFRKHIKEFLGPSGNTNEPGAPFPEREA